MLCPHQTCKLLLCSGVERDAGSSQLCDVVASFLGADVDVVLCAGSRRDAESFLYLFRSKELMYIEECFDAEDSIQFAQAIFIPACNPYHNLDLLYRKSLVEPLREAILKGVPFLGLDGGAMLVCPTIATSDDIPVTYPTSVKALAAVPFHLNMQYFPGHLYRLDSHGEFHPLLAESRDRKINDFLEHNPDAVVIGLPQSGVLKMENGRSSLLSSPVQIFIHDHPPIEIPPCEDLENSLLTSGGVSLNLASPRSIVRGRRSGASCSMFEHSYELGEQIGAGSYSKVYRCREKEIGKVYAVKVLPKIHMTEKDHHEFYTECDILRSYPHPSIVEYKDSFDDGPFYWIVTELLTGGELFDRICDKDHYSEVEARDLVTVLLQVVSHLHAHDVVHRDLKPENLLLVSAESDISFKLCDFGFAVKLDGATEITSTFCGTLSYAAPEIVKHEPHGKPVDMWSLGVIVYTLLCGYPPFHEDNQRMLCHVIAKGLFTFHEVHWSNVSEQAKDFVRRLLTVDPRNRMTADEALEHIWIQSPVAGIEQTHLSQSQAKMRTFNKKRKFKSAADTLMGTRKLLQMLQHAANSITLLHLPRLHSSSTTQA